MRYERYRKKGLPNGGYYTEVRDDEDMWLTETYIIGSGEREYFCLAFQKLEDLIEDIEEGESDTEYIKGRLEDILFLLKKVKECLRSQDKF